MITLIDYGAGNLGSVQNMLKKVGADCRISSALEDIDKAQKIILPGVGAFGPAMEKLRKLNMVELLTKKVMDEKIPVLGICLGMQLMTLGSEEGGCHDGLGWINAQTIKFCFDDPRIKVPHKGWNYVTLQKESRLSTNMEQKFYFDHSYHVVLANTGDELLCADYGRSFTASFEVNNIFGVQFHPEKSHRYGMNLLQRFADL